MKVEGWISEDSLFVHFQHSKSENGGSGGATYTIRLRRGWERAYSHTHTDTRKEKRKKMSEYVHRGAYTPYFLNIQSECLAVRSFSAQFNEAENEHAIINAYE